MIYSLIIVLSLVGLVCTIGYFWACYVDNRRGVDEYVEMLERELEERRLQSINKYKFVKIKSYEKEL